MLTRRTILAGATALAAGGFAGLPAAAQETTRVALIMTGPITDGGWAQLAYEGLETLGEHDGFETAYAENVGQVNIAQVVQGYADDGYDLIIGHGYEFGSAFIEIAPDYPDQSFFASTFQPQDEVPDNVGYIDLAYFDAAYGAGVLAALISEDGEAVGFVGGGDNPTQQRMMASYITGAEATRPNLRGLGIITGDYDNAGRGREAAAAMTANGADVIWHAANVTGLGAIQGAVAEGAKVLGCYSNQTDVAPDRMGASFAMNLGWMVQQVAERVAEDTFFGGEEWAPAVTEMWSAQYGEDGTHNEDIVSDEAWKTFQGVWEDLGSGAIDTAEVVE